MVFENSRTFTFDQNEEEERKKICDEILKVLQKDLGPSCQATCLETIRILSRDKKALTPLTTRPAMLALMRLAGLEYTQSSAQEMPNFSVIIEALKCLCNIVFNSEKAQQLSVDFKLVSGACERLKVHRDKNVPREIKFFDLRLLFLLSALRMDARAQLKEEQGLLLLTDILENTLDIKWSDKYVVATDRKGPVLSNEQADLSMEVLKALFNVTYDCSQQQIDEDRAHQNRHLAAILCHCLLLKTQSEGKTEEFHSHTVNLLNNIPASSLDLLFSPSIKCGTVEYNGKMMDAVEVLLSFMENRIDKGSNLKEGLTPVLSVLTECCRVHRDMRKYIRSRVNLLGGDCVYHLISSINPITGHVEDPMPNPMDGMTEEQKEYEAMKLVNMFDKLSREQIIKPMRVKPDGTIGPLEEAASEYTNDHNSTSDSDENI
ncbi:hypothetical protein chiPu_0013328 [Chiloscyllium punctatum]|uniref:Synembryn n=1 Tax=Chiloscyllium punctatum TaxID=137246 RepID=A0A401SWU2_CHIPU|nr:hypothetical protein [Chiloscyllium punctatum]